MPKAYKVSAHLLREASVVKESSLKLERDHGRLGIYLSQISQMDSDFLHSAFAIIRVICATVANLLEQGANTFHIVFNPPATP
jgi:hypothetical protein